MDEKLRDPKNIDRLIEDLKRKNEKLVKELAAYQNRTTKPDQGSSTKQKD